MPILSRACGTTLPVIFIPPANKLVDYSRMSLRVVTLKLPFHARNGEFANKP